VGGREEEELIAKNGFYMCIHFFMSLANIHNFVATTNIIIAVYKREASCPTCVSYAW
jgi:hypothetical protein